MKNVDLTLVGDGLAGHLVYRSLLRAGFDGDIAWIDAGSARASDVPIALVHPLVGQSLRPKADIQEALSTLENWLDEPHLQDCITRRPILRPVQTGSRLLRSFQKYEKELQKLCSATYLSAKEIQHLHPDLHVGPCIRYERAFALRLPKIITNERTTIPPAHITIEGRALDYQTTSKTIVSIETRKKEHFQIQSRFVVFACFPKFLSPAFPTVERFEGSLKVGTLKKTPSAFVSGGGHFACVDKDLSWGSTYRSVDNEDTRSTHEQWAGIDQRVHHWLGDNFPTAHKAWSGIRVVHNPHREPLSQELDRGVYLLSAFGSKGGLWAPLYAERLVQKVIQG